MFAVTADRIDPTTRWPGSTSASVPDPVAPEGWTTVAVTAASLNHHDLWTLRGRRHHDRPAADGPRLRRRRHRRGRQRGRRARRDRRPGRRRRRRDPRPRGGRCCPSCTTGTLAEQVVVPAPQRRAEAGRALVRGGRLPADGVAHRVPHALHPVRRCSRATRCSCRAPAGEWRPRRSCSAAPRASGSGPPAGTRASGTRALELGAHEVFEPGARLPERVDAVIETVGAATWSHSLKALRPGGRIVVSRRDDRARTRRRTWPGSTSCSCPSSARRWAPATSWPRCSTCASTPACAPTIDQTLPLSEAREAFERMAAGDVVGKLVLVPAPAA